MSREEKGKYCLVYDGGCRLCTAFGIIVPRLDLYRRIVSVPFQEHDMVPFLLQHMNASGVFSSFHLITPQGEIASGEEALPLLLDLMPGGRAWSKAVGLLPFLKQLPVQLYRSATKAKKDLKCGECLKVVSKSNPLSA